MVFFYFVNTLPIDSYLREYAGNIESDYNCYHLSDFHAEAGFVEAVALGCRAGGDI